jgi:hypothetical protein
VLRRPVHEWQAESWTGGGGSREDATRDGSAFGRGSGFFEWSFQDEAIRELGRARRVRVLCEVSARREDTQQTGGHRRPTRFELLLNELRVHREILPDHPHDTRGALSYLRGGKGAYGYLMRATIEDTLLQHVAQAAATTGELRFRCAVPADSDVISGLTVYGHDAGRYPIGPTIVIEWEQG